MIGSGDATVAFRDRPAAVRRLDGIRNHSGFADRRDVWGSGQRGDSLLREASGVLGSATVSARWHRIGSASRTGLSPRSAACDGKVRGMIRATEMWCCPACAMGMKQVGSASSLVFRGGVTAGLQIEPGARLRGFPIVCFVCQVLSISSRRGCVWPQTPEWEDCNDGTCLIEPEGLPGASDAESGCWRKDRPG